VFAAWSGSTDGDLRPSADDDGRALRTWALRTTGGHPIGGTDRTDRTVYWMEQVHGDTVVTVPATGGTGPAPLGVVRAGTADALMSEDPAAALVVLTADCAPVALGSGDGMFAAVHAGWRGLVAGVIDRAVDAMRAAGATGLVGALGPTIHPCCYEFSEADLDTVAAVVGDGVRSTTSDGRPALDVPAAVAARLAANGVTMVAGSAPCTACGDGWFSHRARQDTGRQAMVVWSDGQRSAGAGRA
jgi:YfiH family protein